MADPVTYLVGYALTAFAPSPWLVMLGGLGCGTGQGSSAVLINSAA